MSGRVRLALAAFLLLAVLCGMILVAFAGNTCATDLPAAPCPEAGRNRGVVVALLGLTTWLLVVPFAFLAEFALRRRIVYRGIWGRAMRRGFLAGLAMAAVSGLRLGGALSVPAVLFLVIMVGLVEWFAIRRVDLP